MVKIFEASKEKEENKAMLARSPRGEEQAKGRPQGSQIPEKRSRSRTLRAHVKQTHSREKHSGQRCARRRQGRRRAVDCHHRCLARAPCDRTRRLDDHFGSSLKEEQNLAPNFHFRNGGTRPLLLLRVRHHAADGAHFPVEGLCDRLRQRHGARVVCHHAAPGEGLEQIPLCPRCNDAQEKHDGNLAALTHWRARKQIPPRRQALGDIRDARSSGPAPASQPATGAFASAAVTVGRREPESSGAIPGAATKTHGPRDGRAHGPGWQALGRA